MENCTTCEHAIFDALWGEYRCAVRGTRLYIMLDSSECSDYNKGTPGESKLNADYDAKFVD